MLMDVDDEPDSGYYASQAPGAPGEVLTVSFGPFANFAAAHFWNAREADVDWASVGGGGAAGDKEAGPDASGVHFRPGLTATREPTYTPRALIFDLRDGFGRAGRHGGLYIDDAGPEAALQWDGGVDRIAQPGFAESAYSKHLEQLGTHGYEAPNPASFNLEGTVRTWSDYARTFFHPRSLAALPSELDPGVMPVSLAADIWNAPAHADWCDEALDALRRLAEECGRMQGIQILATTDGWGGLAAGLAERTTDEIGKTDILGFGIDSPPVIELGGRAVHDPKPAEPLRAVERLKAQRLLADSTSLLFPIRMPRSAAPSGWSRHVPRLAFNLPYHTSYLFSTALDTFGVPWRTMNRSMRETIDGLRVMEGVRVAGLAASWPASLYDAGDESGIIRGIEEMLSIKLDQSARFHIPADRPAGLYDFLAAGSARSAAAHVSLPDKRGEAPDVSHRMVLAGLPWTHHSVAKEQLQGTWGVSPLATSIDVFSKPVSQLDSSPAFFGGDLDSRGFISGRAGPPETFPQLVRAYVSPTIGHHLRGMLREAADARRIERVERVVDENWDEAKERWEELIGVYADLES